MKIKFATLALLAAISPGTILAQNNDKFYSGDKNNPFTQEDKKFNDWAISAGVGVPLVQSADLTSIKNGNGKNLFGYSAYLSVDKAITHAFGLNLQYEMGETKQGLVNVKKDAGLGARTQYQALSLLGDINFSNLLRRSDNHSPFRWALHGYAGVGTLGYKAYRQDADPLNPNNKLGENLITENKFLKKFSMFGQAGAGLKFNVNRRIDIEGRLMYVVTGDDNFDGGSGNDTMAGGVGDDFYIVDSVGDVVIENANEGIDQIHTTIDYTLGDNVDFHIMVEIFLTIPVTKEIRDLKIKYGIVL